MINFKDFILLEKSKNDPIPEMYENKKIAFFLFGNPGSGKSTYIKNFLFPLIKNCKIFNIDETSKLLIKILNNPKEVDIDENELEEAKNLLKKFKIKNQFSNEEILRGINNKYSILTRKLINLYIKNFIIQGNNFIYDTTGNDFDNIKDYIEDAKRNGYKIVLIRYKTELIKSIERNINRDRVVPINYLLKSYLKSLTIDKEYLKLNPDNFYIVLELDNKYIYYKYDENGNLLKRKNDIYKKIN